MALSRAQIATSPAAVELPRDHTREMLARLARHACEIAGVDRACVLLRDRLSEVSMTVAAVHGLPGELLGQSFGIVDGMAGRVLLTGRPVLVDDSPAFPRPIEHALGRARPMASVPVSWAGEVRAALSVGSSDPARDIGPRDVAVLCEVAELASHAIEHAERRQDLEGAMRASLATLARTADMRDPRNPQQSEQVAELAGAVGAELGLDGDDLAELRLAALLRDVGKLAVPDGVLRKPGPLSAREWDVIRRHPEWGGEMIFAIPGLEGVAAIVVHHHESYDGGGYPDRLTATDIPLQSRIVAVCDAYHAMISDRSYRPALRPITAIRELQRRAGSQFDPEAVAALVRAARIAPE
jgi:hypothetical protein